MSEEANKEIDGYLNSKISMMDADGSLIYGLSGNAANVQMAMTFLTFNPLPN